MDTALECIPCFIQQALRTARMVSDDPRTQEQLVRDALALVARSDFRVSPPQIAQQMYRRLRELSGVADPYRDHKERFDRVALELLPRLRGVVAEAPDPLEAAVRLAAAGNLIDMGIHGDLDEDGVRSVVDQARELPMAGAVGALAAAAGRAGRILFLADNAGEIVLDRLLLEQLPSERITLAVRGGPIINDATRNDVGVTAVSDLVPVIDNGSDAPGTVLSDCSPRFLEAFDSADLVIAKGQGNYETLHDVDKPVIFLLMVKCPMVAKMLGQPLGSMVIAAHRLDGAEAG